MELEANIVDNGLGSAEIPEHVLAFRALVGVPANRDILTIAHDHDTTIDGLILCNHDVLD